MALMIVSGAMTSIVAVMMVTIVMDNGGGDHGVDGGYDDVDEGGDDGNYENDNKGGDDGGDDGGCDSDCDSGGGGGDDGGYDLWWLRQ